MKDLILLFLESCQCQRLQNVMFSLDVKYLSNKHGSLSKVLRQSPKPQKIWFYKIVHKQVHITHTNSSPDTSHTHSIGKYVQD